MTSDGRVLLTSALNRTRSLRQRYPEERMLKLLEQQLEYLEALGNGQRSDVEHLKNIDLGVIAAKEIEETDDELAGWLYALDKDVRRMQRKLPR